MEALTCGRCPLEQDARRWSRDAVLDDFLRNSNDERTSGHSLVRRRQPALRPAPPQRHQTLVKHAQASATEVAAACRRVTEAHSVQ